MALIDDLLRAAFNDAEFLISSSSTAGGRKDQRHEFPNSDKQTIEDLGLQPRTYNVVGWITEPNYVSKRDALLEALESGEPGVLSHPFYGELGNMKARSFTISETMGELGRAEISMVFEISNSLGTPVETENTLSLINDSNDELQSAASNEIADNWEVDAGFSGNFAAAQDKLGSLSDSYGTVSSVVTQATDKINAFNAQVSNFSENINSLISAPRALADSITNISTGMNALYATAESQFIAWRGFFGFGDDDIQSVNQTAGLTQRDKNNTAINQSMQSQALGYGYLAAAQIDYDTVDDLDQIVEQLETQYQKIVTDNSVGQALRDSITDMRENTNAFFDQRRITLNRVITVNTAELPARVIAYQYYADSSLGEEIASLNNDANVSFLEGSIQVITQ